MAASSACPPMRGLLAGLLGGHVDIATPTGGQWTSLLAEARAQQLAGQLAELVLANPEHARLDPNLLTQMQSAKRVADGHARAMRWELDRLGVVFGRLDIQPILLKGAAYCLCDLPAAKGRQYGDVDLLVPESRLAEVEDALRFAGYGARKTSPYEQHYYRTWMHEIPPLQHMHRGTALDVHFRLIPRTSRIAVDHASLLADAPAAEADPRFRVLSPAAMVLHSMLHLYTESEFPQGLRNLLDIHLLLRDFGHEPGFKERLRQLANDAGAVGVVNAVAHWRAQRFGTLAEQGANQRDTAGSDDLGALQSDRLGAGQRLTAALVFAALDPTAAQQPRGSRRAALAALYLRGHYLRMPLRLLMPHLWHQARSQLTREGEA